MKIAVNVNKKIASAPIGTTIVCGNSDYIINFSFDDEWLVYETKTARFKWNKAYTDVVFTGNECAMPVVNDAAVVEVGVYAGNLHTTTPALIRSKKSILCDTGSPADPTPDVYAQIMEKLNSLDGIEPATSDKLGGIKVGENLSITEDGTLSADASEVKIDNKTIVKDADGSLKANVSLPAATKDGAILAGSNSEWKEVDASGGYGYQEMLSPIVFTSDMYDAAEKVYETDEETGEQSPVFAKISDEFVTVEEMKSFLTMIMTIDGESMEIDLASAPYNEYVTTFGETGANFLYGMSCSQPEDIRDIIGTEDVYMLPAGTWVEANMAREYTSITIKHGIKHKIANDYIPSTVAVVNLDAITTDDQFDSEIREKFSDGMTVMVNGCLVLSVSDSESVLIVTLADGFTYKFTLANGKWSPEKQYLEASRLIIDDIQGWEVNYEDIPCTQVVYNLVRKWAMPMDEGCGDGALARYDLEQHKWGAVRANGGYGYSDKSTDEVLQKIEDRFLPDNAVKVWTFNTVDPYYSEVKEKLEAGYTLHFNTGSSEGGRVIDWKMTINEDPTKSVLKFVFDKSPSVRKIYKPYMYGDTVLLNLSTYTVEAVNKELYLQSSGGDTFKITVDADGTLYARKVTT